MCSAVSKVAVKHNLSPLLLVGLKAPAEAGNNSVIVYSSNSMIVYSSTLASLGGLALAADQNWYACYLLAAQAGVHLCWPAMTNRT
ncbi:MAG: hypothetical protein FRX49_11598 [Trebouxia sp. A1-2]|nr:MAG: hypothetical protein FRX49_11598 [Trebouxia sp. A1-2]